ncbi:3',5'-cyclic adenosine monophosphate phosphodiesterase CpdA [mine drainage metagenome]|uniref:3',5'-cyclic adenosine monophosphate phosphodiesterase CpdA n=1 Tax=mine drainage metagenome TaxID=410659 RepID=A0A1J5PA36_9ZZZZ
MKLIHITDPHLVAPGRSLYGIDPEARLRAAVQHVCARHADAEACVLTGDLTHWGEDSAYARLRDCLRPLPMPVLPLIGNHDDRTRFRAAFPEVPVDAGGFVQWTHDTSGGRLFLLDTVLRGDETGRTSAGYFGGGRIDWLRARLDAAQADGVAVYLFMHHPPFSVGIKAFDDINLIARDALDVGALLRQYRNIRHLFFGHVHRPIFGSWQGIPFSTLPATAHQSALDFDADKDLFSHEAPGYGVALISPEQVTVHICDFLYAGPLFDPASERQGG